MFGLFKKNQIDPSKKNNASFDAFKNEKLLPFSLDTDELSCVIWDIIDDCDDNGCCHFLMAYSTLQFFDLAVRTYKQEFGVSKSVEDLVLEALFKATEKHDDTTIRRCTWILLALLLRSLGKKCDLDENDAEHLAASWIKMCEASPRMKAVMKSNALWSDEEQSSCLQQILFSSQHSTNAMQSFAPMEKIKNTLAFESFLEEVALRYVAGTFLPLIDFGNNV